MLTIAIVNLRAKGLEVFQPQIATEKLVKAKGRAPRLMTVFEPLFSGYLFVRRGDDEARSHLLNARGIRGMVMAGSVPGLVPDRIIDQLKHEQARGYLRLPLRIKPRFAKGQVLQVTEGPLTGHLVIVEGMTREDRVRVLLSIFERQTFVELTADTLKPRVST